MKRLARSRGIWHLDCVSVAQIKQELKALSRDERLTVAEYLEVLNQLDDPMVREEVSSAMDRMDSGRKISEDEVYAAHERRLA